MIYIAVDVNGMIDRGDLHGDTNDPAFDLLKFFAEDYAIFQDSELGRANAQKAKADAKAKYLKSCHDYEHRRRDWQ